MYSSSTSKQVRSTYEYISNIFHVMSNKVPAAALLRRRRRDTSSSKLTVEPNQQSATRRVSSETEAWKVRSLPLTTNNKCNNIIFKACEI